MRFKKLAALVMTAVTAFSTFGMAAAEDYNAYIGIQGDQWSYRNSWTDATYGLEGTGWAETDGLNFNSGVITGETATGTITDTVISGDGTYTVSLKGIEWKNGDSTLNLLFVSTSIPYDTKYVDANGYLTNLITNATVKFDGTEVFNSSNVLQSSEVDYVRLELINVWNGELETFSEALPTDVEITFTVDFPDDEAAAEETTTEETTTEDTTTEETTTEETTTEETTTEDATTEEVTTEDTTTEDTTTDAATAATSTPTAVAEAAESGNGGLIAVLIVAIILPIAAGIYVYIKKKKN